jgi:CheY-like chemotaxis protein
MNAVIGMADLLQHTPLSSDQQHYVEIIRNSGDALLSVIDDILDLSKLEAGKFVAQAADFDLQSLVEEVLDMLAHRAQGKGVELACLVDEGVATSLRGDAGCLRQVLLNLLGNAIKFTDHGEVHARVRLLEETPAEVRLEVEVRDSGIGIPEDLRPRLFDAFVQGDMSSKRRYGGAGLGLAISRSLVEMMGGTIRVESQMGQGSAFFFDCRFERQAAAQERLPDMEPARGVRSLVVGDNAVVREYLCADLRRWGMRADAAAGAGQALGLLGAAGDDPYRIALVDVRMAEVDGLTLVRRARLDPALVATRFVLLRPLTEPLDPSLLAAAGADAQISKPVRLAWLAETLLGLLAASPARAAPVPAVAAAPRRPARVLVAEDNPINQEVALLILRKLGYRVDAVGSGRAALQALADRRYDIVFMDGQMPEMDGYEAAAEIRRREGAARRTPIVAMTAHALEGDRERCLDAGMDDCLFKPVTEGKLIEALQRWLPAASAPETVLDPEVWEALARVQAGGTAEFIPRLIDLFLDDATQRLASLRAAHAAGDRVRIAREAHALKGGARQMGAADLARACGDLQAGADRAGADTDLGGLIAEVEEACWTVEQALHAQRAAWAAPGPGAGAA